MAIKNWVSICFTLNDWSNYNYSIAQERLDDELDNYFSKANPAENATEAKEAPKEAAKVEEENKDL